MDDGKLRHLLSLPPVPDALRSRLHENLDQCVGSESRRRKRYLAGVGVSAVVLLLLLSMTLHHSYISPPTYVLAAYDDMYTDQPLHGALDGGSDRWLAKHAINLPPRNMLVDLSKNCQLGRFPSKHIRLVSTTAGRINLFIHMDSRSTGIGDLKQGEWGGQSWMLLEPRPGLLVAVLYERDLGRSQVIELMGLMFGFSVERPADTVMESNNASMMDKVLSPRDEGQLSSTYLKINNSMNS